MRIAWLRSIGRWFEDRAGLGAIAAVPMAHRVPRSTASWAYVFGSATLSSSCCRSPPASASPSCTCRRPDQACESLQYLDFQAPFGWFCAPCTSGAPNAMVLVMTLHMIQVFLFGAHKYPAGADVEVGVFLLFVCTLGMAFTGQILRWDQDAYWGLGIGASIIYRVRVGDALVQRCSAGRSSPADALAVLHAARLRRSRPPDRARGPAPLACASSSASTSGRCRAGWSTARPTGERYEAEIAAGRCAVLP